MKEREIIRNVQPNDVIVFTFPANSTPKLIEAVLASRQYLGCKVIAVTDGIEIGHERRRHWWSR